VHLNRDSYFFHIIKHNDKQFKNTTNLFFFFFLSKSRSTDRYLVILQGSGNSVACDALRICPGFGQDRVDFHQNPGRGTAGWADPTPTWPNRARYSIPCAVMLGSGGGGQRGRNSLAVREGSAAVRSERAGLFCGFVLCIPLFCVVVVPVPSVCCSVELPLSRPTGSCLFSFHSPPHRGGGRGGRVALLLPAAAQTRTGSDASFI